MAITELFNVVNKEIEYSELITAPSNSGQIIIDVKEDEFTEKMKRGLAGILFTMYIKVDGVEEYIPVKDRSYIWNSKADLSMIITDIPGSFYFGVQPIIDSYYDMKEYLSVVNETFDNSIKYYSRKGNGTVPNPYVYYINPDVNSNNFNALKKDLYKVDTSIDYDSFPITVSFDNAGQSSGGGSGGVQPQKQTVTLLATDWDNNKAQVANVSGVTATNIIFVSPNTDSYEAYGSANIRATEQAEGTLKFVCDTVPTDDINVNVVIM